MKHSRRQECEREHWNSAQDETERRLRCKKTKIT